MRKLGQETWSPVINPDGSLWDPGMSQTSKVGSGMGDVVRVSEQDVNKAKVIEALTQFLGVQRLLDRFGGQEPPVGTVIRWTKKYNKSNPTGQLVMERGSGSGDVLTFNVQASSYVFVAFRAPTGDWYVTGSRGNAQRTWETLVKDIGNDECFLASDWTEVPAPDEVDLSDADPIAFAKSFLKPKDDTKSA
jgi:hypothetical protein